MRKNWIFAQAEAGRKDSVEDLPGQTRCILQSTNAQPTRLVCHIKGADVSRARTNTTVFPFDLRAPPPVSTVSSNNSRWHLFIFFDPSLFPRDDIFLRFSQRDIFSPFFARQKLAFGERKLFESRIIISRQRNTCN